MFHYVDITEFSTPAVGDGVTDNRVAITAAIAYAVANGYGGIFVPAGTFVISRNPVAGTTAAGSLSGIDMQGIEDFAIVLGRHFLDAL